MAPQTKAARKSKLPKSPFSSKAPIYPPQDSQSESGAELELAHKQDEPGWEGFEDEEESSEDENDESIDIIIEEEEDVLEKDGSEEELERLVFGDSVGFKAGLKSFSQDFTAGAYDEELEEEEGGEDWENKADQDLFFFDSGPGAAPAGTLVAAETDEVEEDGDKPAWEDSDDDRLVISLASVPRLRKLRETEQDDVVGGEEYIRRLRKQYERLYPMPEWAVQATGKSKTKRRRTLDDGESEEVGSDMDVDDENDLSTQPLARLLKDADILSRNSSHSAKRRKLQPGTVNIQKLRDVAKPGPVCTSLLHSKGRTNQHLVRNYFSFIPSYLSAAPKFWTEFNAISPSYHPQPFSSESAAHVPPH